MASVVYVSVGRLVGSVESVASVSVTTVSVDGATESSSGELLALCAAAVDVTGLVLPVSISSEVVSENKRIMTYDAH